MAPSFVRGVHNQEEEGYRFPDQSLRATGGEVVTGPGWVEVLPVRGREVVAPRRFREGVGWDGGRTCRTYPITTLGGRRPSGREDRRSDSRSKHSGAGPGAETDGRGGTVREGGVPD